jgi:cobalt-zinc-cadmium efflux system membrane fusion protein
VELPPADRASASAALAAVISSIRAAPGQTVKAGDVLAEVVSPELFTLQLDLIRADLDLRLERGTLDRIRGLDAVARRQVWESEGRAATLAAQVETLRLKLAAAGLSAAEIDGVVETMRVATAVKVRSPVGGVVVSFEAAVGQAVAAREPLFTVHDPAHPRVVGAVGERDFGRVRVGQPVRVRLVSAPDALLIGRVTRVGQAVGAESRALSVWVNLDDAGRRPLVHAQLATLTVVTGTRSPALSVPLAAVGGEPGAAFVFVRRPDGVFERRAVETGAADDRRVEIVHGLAAGETVATAGVAELASGYAALR